MTDGSRGAEKERDCWEPNKVTLQDLREIIERETETDGAEGTTGAVA